MSQGNIEEDAARRNYTKPYGGKHPIPTIQGYRQHRKDIEDRYGHAEDAQEDQESDSKTRRAYDSAKTILKDEDQHETNRDPYPNANRNDQQRPRADQEDHRSNDQANKKDRKDGQTKSATEEAASSVDPRAKRKAMKKTKRSGGGREVTDPVTHLPLTIRDQTEKDLHAAPENNPPPGTTTRTATGLSGASKSDAELTDEQQELQRSYNGLQRTFPPPDFDDTRQELASIYGLALTIGLSGVLGISIVAIFVTGLINWRAQSTAQYIILSLTLLSTLGIGGFVVVASRSWLQNKVKDLWDDELWDAARKQEQDEADADAELPESVQWLNSWLTSVWPLINPDLFASLVDTLEDVMQASLPKIVRMVSVDDMGQGSESIRILGIKWLPTGAASQTVDEKGNLKKPEKNKSSDRTAHGEGEEEHDAEADSDNGEDERDDKQEQQKKQQEQEQEAMKAGMEAEEGDFVNMELAFAYRARSSGKSIRSKAKNAHLYLKFYLPGGIAVPVWVELRGIMGIMRVVSGQICTLT